MKNSIRDCSRSSKRSSNACQKSAMMTRRRWLSVSAAAFAGCGSKAEKFEEVQAGPFAATVPKVWMKSALVERVPLQPLYTEQGWLNFTEDPMNQLKGCYGNRPTHWAIRLPAAAPFEMDISPEEFHSDPVAPQILIHKAVEWGLALTDGVHHEEPVEDVVRRLAVELYDWKSKDLPHGMPGFVDGSLTFVCLKKSLEFQGGEGIRMVCQWNFEPDLVRRKSLHYLFLGLSDDLSCQIIASFPLDLPGLPSDEPNEKHLGWSMESYEELARRFATYEAEAKEWIENGKSEIKPSLESLDSMMMSLVANTWSDA